MKRKPNLMVLTPQTLGVKRSHCQRQHECRQCTKCITLMMVNVVCALPHMMKIFETNLARNGLNVPVGDGYTKTVVRTVC